MSKKWVLLLILMLSVGLNVGFLAGRLASPKSAPTPEASPSQPVKDESPPLPKGVERISKRMADELGLQGDRRRTFLDMQKSFFQTSAEGRQRLQRARRELRAQLTADRPDRKAAEHWAEELGAAQADLERAFVAVYFDTRDLVEPEQYPKLRRLMARIHQMRRQLLERSTRPRPGSFRDRRDRRRPDGR